MPLRGRNGQLAATIPCHLDGVTNRHKIHIQGRAASKTTVAPWGWAMGLIGGIHLLPLIGWGGRSFRLRVLEAPLGQLRFGVARGQGLVGVSRCGLVDWSLAQPLEILPFCNGRRVSVTNSLAALHPTVAAQWHRTKNGNTTPEQVVAGSHIKFWWQYPEAPEHEWESTLSNKVQGRFTWLRYP
jgi:hypothetical protein